jgi:FkbM family methyltransferase
MMMNLYHPLKLHLRAHRIRRHGDSEIALLPTLVGYGRRAVDVGANRGVYTYWLARCCAQVEAFEPNPDLARTLARSIGHNVTVHAVALSDHGGVATLSVPRHRKGGLADPAGSMSTLPAGVDGARFEIQRCRLDDLHLNDVDFMKIDVEGHEEAVLDGAWETILRWRPTLLIELEERHRSGCLERVGARLAGAGYATAFRDSGAWRGMTELGTGQIGPSGRYINNFLFVAEGRAVPRATAPNKTQRRTSDQG